MKGRNLSVQSLLHDAEYNSKSNLYHHIKSIHERKRYECTICNASLTTKAKLRKHIEFVREGKKPFRCDICDVKFAEKGTLDNHIRTVHEKPKHIDETKKVFHCQMQFLQYQFCI